MFYSFDIQLFISTFGVIFLETMNEQRILEELLELLQANNVIVRSEPLGGSGGGLCTVKGQNIFFVDTQAQSADVASLCAEAVSNIVDIEKIYIRPEVRQFIENYRHNKKFGGKQ